MMNYAESFVEQPRVWIDPAGDAEWHLNGMIDAMNQAKALGLPAFEYALPTDRQQRIAHVRATKNGKTHEHAINLLNENAVITISVLLWLNRI